MIRNSALRLVVIAVVWGAATVAAVWLAGGLQPTASAPGLVSVEEYRLSSLETARVASVLVTPGQRVAGGQLIARLDTSVLEREIAVAEAHLRQLASETGASEAELLSAGYESERSFRAAVDEASAQVEDARAQQEREAAEMRQISEEVERQRSFLREGLTTRERVDELELRRRTLAAAAAQWPDRIRGLEERLRASHGRLAEWRSRYSANSASAPRSARLQPLRQRATEQIEALRVLHARRENAKIFAAADGEVVSVNARPGDIVRAGDPFIVLNGSGPRRVLAYVPERAGGSLREGARARLRRRTAGREEFESRVVRVADTVTLVPSRLWLAPQVPSYGREVVVELPRAAHLDPGEALDVTFLDGGAL